MSRVRPCALRWFPCMIFAGTLLSEASGLSAQHGAAQEGPLPSFQNVLEAMNKPAEDAANKKAGPLEGWRAKYNAFIEGLNAYRAAVPALPPSLSAERWLGFLDQAEALHSELDELSKSAGRSFDYLSFRRQIDGENPRREVMAALPSPEHWPDIATAIKARPLPTSAEEDVYSQLRALGLRSLAAMLVNDKPERTQLAKDIEDLIKKNSQQLQQLQYGEPNLERGLAALRGAGNDDSLKRFTQLVEAGEPAEEVRVPNLVAMAGEETAEKLLTRILTELNWSLREIKGSKTRKLLEKLIVEHSEDLSQPQWSLVNGPNTVALYEAMESKFPRPTATEDSLLNKLSEFGQHRSEEDPYERDQAWANYLLAKISASTLAEAQSLIDTLVKQVKSDPNSTFVYQLSELNNPEITWHITKELVKDSKLPAIWEPYITSGITLHKEEEVFSQLRKATAQDKADKSASDELSLTLAEGYLSAGQSELAQSLLMELASEASVPTETAGKAIYQLVKLGKVPEKPDVLTKAAELARARLKQTVEQFSQDGFEYTVSRLQSALAELELREEEMQLLIWRLRPKIQELQGKDREYRRPNDLFDEQLRMVQLYAEGKQYDQVIAMLQENPYWGASDWIEFINERRYSNTARNKDAAVATALYATGQRELGRQLLELQLRLELGNDRLYERLLIEEKDLASLLPLFETLKQQNQFQERPWIWQAEVLRQMGKLPEAEAAIRKAITIDPSDGEQPHGDRMRAYAVLAEILAAGNSAKEAEFYRQVVKAIRLAEQADDLHEAGHNQRAIEEYQAALKLFSDAYCIQSRLALQLASLGRNEEAAEHYRKAFELMPDSFGRVESHCFGCEGAFKSRMAQLIAEEVFTELSNRPNVKPQVHYLLAYLRFEQERHPEAAASLWRAVEADPDYLNAWQKLKELASEGDAAVSAEEREKIELNLLRLNPFESMRYFEIEAIDNLPELWKILEGKLAQQVTFPAKLIPLPASERFMKEQAQADQAMPLRERNRRQAKYAGELMQHHPALAFCTALLGLSPEDR